MLKEHDTVIVTIDDTAESVLCAFLFRELMWHGKFEFNVIWHAEKEPDGNLTELFKENGIEVVIKDSDTVISEVSGTKRLLSYECYDEVNAYFLSGILKRGEIKCLMPVEKTESEDCYVIRPLYQVHREDIEKFLAYACLDDLMCRQLSSEITDAETLISSLREENQYVDSNIFAGMENINKNTLVGYKDEEGYHTFLEWYDKYPDII